jgi:isocitrate dehydrogenase kinase/phosphatase
VGGPSYPNSKRTPTSRLANATAQAICQAFDQSQLRFREITRRAAKRFDQRDWHGMHRDSAARLDVYEMAVDRIVARVRELLDDRLRSRLAWVSIKAVYSGLIHDRDDLEIVETFFNSITRRIFDTVGVDEEIEFVHTDYESPPSHPKRPAYRTLDVCASLAQGIEGWLAASFPPLGDQEVQRQAMVASSCIERQLGQLDSQAAIDHIEILDSVFYRGDFACLIGRIRCARRMVPLRPLGSEATVPAQEIKK